MPDLNEQLRGLCTALEPDEVDERPMPRAPESVNATFLDALRAEWARMMAGRAPAPRTRVRAAPPAVRQA